MNSIAWSDVNNLQTGALSEKIKQQPRLHIDNLIVQVALPQFAQYIFMNNIRKLSQAIKEINLESPLVRRLYYALSKNSKIFPNQEKRFVHEQLKTAVSIEGLLSNYFALEPQERERRKTDLLFLISQGEFTQFPEKSENGTAFFRFLCQRGGDAALYPILAKLIERSLKVDDREIDEKQDVDIYNQDPSNRNGFDDFLDEGGNIPALLNKVPLECLESRAYNYFDCNETTIRRLSPVEVVIILSVPEVRHNWLNNLQSLDFLEESKLKAFAQFVNFETPKGLISSTHYLKQYLPHIVKFNFLQQTLFLESLSPSVRQKVSAIYTEKQGGFADKKLLLTSTLQTLMPYVENSELPQDQRAALQVLSGGNSHKTHEGEVPFAVFQQINSIIPTLQTLNLWSGNPQYEHALSGLRTLLKTSRKRQGQQEEKVLRQALSDAALETLKYEVLRETLSSIANTSDIDIDWDEYVKTFYQNVEIPQKPGRESDLFKPWQVQTRSCLKHHLSTHFSSAKTMEDVMRLFNSSKPPRAKRKKGDE